MRHVDYQVDAGALASTQFSTRQTENIALDPLDENYIISSGLAGDPSVNVWDIRFVSRSQPGSPGDGARGGPVLELRPAVDGRRVSKLMYSGTRRGRFGILSNAFEVKIVDTAQHQVSGPLEDGPPNSAGGFPWNSSIYVRRSHRLQGPAPEQVLLRREAEGAVSFDFVGEGSPFGDNAIIALHQSREVHTMNVPNHPPLIHLTAMNELYRDGGITADRGDEKGPIAKPASGHETIASDLRRLQEKVRMLPKGGVGQSDRQSANGVNGGPYGKSRSNTPEQDQPATAAGPPSSRERHELLVAMGYPEVQLDLPDLLTVLDTAKRRAKEGYMLVCKRNKQVVSNDPWLVHLWEIIGRMENLAKEDGMVSGGLDLSYLGVEDIWTNYLPPPSRARSRYLDPDATPERASQRTFINAVKAIHRAKDLPKFAGVPTKYPEHRQLCLALCGWSAPKERVRHKSIKLLERGEQHKAVVLAVLKGHKDVALDLLRQATAAAKRRAAAATSPPAPSPERQAQQAQQNVSLAAVIAACDSLADDQRAACAWMADEATDPYLRALLTYFTTGSHAAVAAMPALPLTDRAAVALKYLDDRQVTSFLRGASASAVAAGAVEGVVLTGLGRRAADLFAARLARTGDLQTAVLALARTHPLHHPPHAEPRFPLWLDAYAHQLQAWRLFLERARLAATHNALAVDRAGRCLVPRRPRQMTVRCAHCQMSLARRPAAPSSDEDDAPAAPPAAADDPPPAKARRPPRPSPALAAGLICPRCGAPMPRCGVCAMYLGTPSPATPGGAAALRRGGATAWAEDPRHGGVVLCAGCGHGFHGGHAREWFARHGVCPVVDCGCVCGVVR